MVTSRLEELGVKWVQWTQSEAEHRSVDLSCQTKFAGDFAARNSARLNPKLVPACLHARSGSSVKLRFVALNLALVHRDDDALDQEKFSP